MAAGTVHAVTHDGRTCLQSWAASDFSGRSECPSLQSDIDVFLLVAGPPSYPSPGGQGKHDKITVFKGSLDFKDFSQAWGQGTG